MFIFCKNTERAERERETDLSDKDKQIRRQMFDKYQAELYSREVANSQAYDKSILTLSSAGFALSFTAIELINNLKGSESTWLIIAAWWLFFTTIFISISTFLVGNAAINKQIDFARDYYIDAYVDAASKKSWLVSLNSILNILAGITFLTAVAFTILFFTKSVGGL